MSRGVGVRERAARADISEFDFLLFNIEHKRLPFQSVFARSIALLRFVVGREIAVLPVQDLQTIHLQYGGAL